MQILRYRIACAVVILALLMQPLFAFAAEQSQLQLSEQKIKAGLIYNFLKYTEWPPSKTEGPLVVCIFGSEDPFSGYLNPIEERTVNQRTITVRHVSSIEKTDSCHMLFISGDEQAQWPALHRFLADKSVLTVGDFDGFSKAGGMIEFGAEENRIQIGLNIQAVTEAHLRIYDSLRKLAKTTHPSSPGGAE
jgi:hypothetical protein